MHRTLVRLVAVAAAAVAASAVGGTLSASSNPASHANRLTGTWIGTVTRPAPLPALRSLQVFNSDGTAVESSNEPPGTRSPQFATWERIDGRRYAATGQHFIFNPQTGEFVGTRKISRTIELAPDGQTFTAVARVTTLDASGNVVGQGTATATAQRMQVERAADEP
jgi:hypothetical protein